MLRPSMRALLRSLFSVTKPVVARHNRRRVSEIPAYIHMLEPKVLLSGTVDAVANEPAALVIDDDLGAVGATAVSRSGTLSFGDSLQFKFTLSNPGTFNVQFAGLTENVNVQLFNDVNANGNIDSGELAASQNGINGSTLFQQPLQAGKFILTVATGSNFVAGESTPYTLDFSHVNNGEQDAGGALNQASNVGTLTASPVTRTDVMQVGDVDVYKFNLSSASNILVALSGVNERVNYELIEDRNGNFTVDSGEVYEQNSVVGAVNLNESLRAGNYYLRVTHYYADANTAYQLAFSATPIAGFGDAGETLAVPGEVGTLTGTARSFVDQIQPGDVDVYKFNLSATSNITVTLSGADERVSYELVEDRNNSGSVESDEKYEQNSTAGAATLIEPLRAGNYYLRVTHYYADTNTSYGLSFSATPIEGFDDGGGELLLPTNVQTLTETAAQYVDQIQPGDVDVYKFNLADASHITVSLSGAEERVSYELVEDRNGNFFVDAGEEVYEQNSTASVATLNEPLRAGNYYLRVTNYYNDTNTAYNLAFSAIPINGFEDAGESLELPSEVGPLTGTARTYVDQIQPDDVDVYKFTLSAASNITITLYDAEERVSYELAEDLNNNGEIDSGEVYEQSSTAGSATLNEALEAGNYYFRITHYYNDTNTSYKASFLANPIANAFNAGALLASSRNMGTVSTNPKFAYDVVQADDADIYKFNVPNTATIVASVANLDERATVQWIQDMNGNGNIDPADVVQSSSSTSSVTYNRAVAAGTYFVRVLPYSDIENSSYRLSLVSGLAPGPQELTVMDGSVDLVDGDATVDFGGVDHNAPAVLKTLTVINTGDADLTLQPATVTANSGFTIVSNLTAGQVLTPGGFATVVLRLDTAVVGNKSAALSFANSDGNENPFNVSLAGNVLFVNTAPTIGGAQSNLTVNDTATISPFANLTVADPDNQNMLAKVTILNGFVRGDFTAASSVGWTPTISGNNIVYSRYYSAAPNIGATVQAAIRGLVFQPRRDAIKPGTTEATAFSVFVNDGTANTTNSQTLVVTTSVNDAPSIGAAAANQAVNDNATLAPFAALTVSDPDSQESLVTIRITNGVVRGDFTNAVSSGWTRSTTGNNIEYKRYFSPAANIGSAVQAAIRSLVFQPRVNAIKPGTTETTTFSVTVSDGKATPTVNTATSVITTSVNNAPTIGGTVAGQTMNDSQTRAVFSTVTVTDPDTQDMLVKVTITNGVNRGDFTVASAAGWTKTLSGANIVYNRYFNQAANIGAAAQAAVRALVFQPRNNVAIGTTETTTFTVFVNDGIANVTNSATTVITTGVAPRSVFEAAAILEQDIATIVIPSTKRAGTNSLARLLKKSS